MAPESTKVLLPNLGLEIEDAEILEWMVAVGDRVERGQALATLGTDKTDVDLEAERDGYLLEILHPEGARVPVGTPIAVIGDAPDASAATPAPAPSEPVTADARSNGSAAPLSRSRRLTAERVALSQQVPQFDVFREVDTAPIRALVKRVRGRTDGAGAAVGFNDVLIRAYARTLREHPRLNSAFADGDGGPVLTEHDAVHVGLAVATGAGLVVPVIHDAATRTLAEIAAERVRLVAAARDGALAPGELVGSTTTLSSLAGFRIDGFNAMVNPPHAAILAVGPARERPVARDGAVVVARTMTLTLTVDHRVVDGSESAAALAALADLLESDAALADLEER